jgi:hypothetical protein
LSGTVTIYALHPTQQDRISVVLEAVIAAYPARKPCVFAMAQKPDKR